MRMYHWFIPNKKNKFHPPALRPLGLAIFLLIYLAIPPLYNMTTTRQFQVLGYATNITAGSLHSLSNQERSKNGLGGFNLNSQLSSAARAKANHMIANNYWAHTAPDGTSPWSFISASGYNYSTAGENLAKNFSTSSGVVAGWIGSSAHRANVLSGTYKDVGYAVVNGTLLGEQTTLVVAMYASKSSPPPAPTPATQPQQPQQTPDRPAQPPAPAPKPDEKPKPKPKETPKEPEEEAPEQQPTTTITQETEEGTDITTSIAPVSYSNFNWGQRASLLLLSGMFLLFIMKHTLVWREQKRGYRHIWLRSHPLGQAAILAVALIVTIISGVGAVL